MIRTHYHSVYYDAIMIVYCDEDIRSARWDLDLESYSTRGCAGNTFEWKRIGSQTLQTKIDQLVTFHL